MKKYILPIFFSFLSTISWGQQATFNWVSENISEGDNLQGMTVTGDSSAVIVGYNNILMKKNIDAESWTKINAFKPTYDFIGMGSNGGTTVISSRRAKIVDHPTGGKPDVYVSSVLLKSDDEGETWSLMDGSKIGSGTDPKINPNATGAYNKDIYSVGVFNADTFLVYSGWYTISTGTKESEGAIFQTNNGGEAWEPIVTGLGSRIINAIVVRDSIAISGGNKSLFKTNILSGTTTDIYPNLALGTDSDLYVFAVEMINPDTFYLTTTADGVFKTTDGGNTFTMYNGIGGGNDILPLNDSSIIVLGSSTKSKITTNNGATWTDCYPGETCFKIGGVLGDTLYGLANAVTYKIAVADLVEKNFNWVTHELNPDERLQKMCIYNPNNALIIGYAEMCKKTTDGGLTWNQSSLPESFDEDIQFDFSSLSNNGESAFATVRRFKIVDFPSSSEINDFFMEGLILGTTDNWTSYSLLDISKIGINEDNDASLNPQLEGCYGLNPYIIECVDNSTAFLYANWYETVTTGESESRGRIFKTTDRGETWTGITPDFGASYINSIEFSGDTGYIAGNSILLKTTDGGENFIDLYPALADVNDGDSSIFINSVVMSGKDEFYLPTPSDGVFVTTDGGETFSKIDGVAGTNDIYLLDRNSFILLGSTSKSYFTNDGGTNWLDPSVGKTVYSIGQVFNDSLYALSNGVIYKIAVEDLDIKTSSKEITQNNEIQVQYAPDHINIASGNNLIEQCFVYSVTGQLVTIKQPNTNVCRLYNNEYRPGIYLVMVSVKGKKITEKIVFQ